MSFSLDVSEFAKVVDKRAVDVQRALAIDVFGKIVLRTPVDTGRLRGNWNISYDQPDRSKDKTGPDPNGTYKLAEIKVKAQAIPKGQSIWMTNNLDYAPVVEYGGYPSKGGETPKTINGFSKQAPKGMVRVTLSEFSSAIKKAIAKAKR